MKKVLLWTAGIALLVICFKGVLYRCLVQYQEIGQRATILIENEKIKSDLDNWINAHPAATVTQIVDFAREYSTGDIRYTFGKCSTNPNQIVVSKRTNCIGYSALFQSVLQYLLDKNGITGINGTHKIGQLYIGSFNMHTLFKDPAFKDHDYNVVTDQRTNTRYIIDPTLNASFGIKRVTERN